MAEGAGFVKSNGKERKWGRRKEEERKKRREVEEEYLEKV